MTKNTNNSYLINKFSRVNTDMDTYIESEKYMKYEKYHVLYQKWAWEALHGESIIFDADDVTELTDKNLEDIACLLCNLSSDARITLKRSCSGYDFVNFNFRVQ